MVGLLVGGITLPSYHLIQAREAAVVGLLVGSLSASYRQPLLKALKALCKVCCRECYTLTQPQPFTLIPTPTLPLTLTLTLTVALTLTLTFTPTLTLARSCTSSSWTWRCWSSRRVRGRGR